MSEQKYFTDAIVVGVNLDGSTARSLDAACGATLESRAGYVRRALVEALRRDGFISAPKRPIARHRPEATR